ncbi:DMT family transporter [Anaeromyxobacter oryzae]|uniref:Drug/metabolite exporter YedA n=1 Tax=Anaeromyxobacter oryzae TaxID=2918170 RepID=A0ABM7WWC5_9BACT|nr:EamA family transporter [Anaeromyxobacter oryzae]BDG03776.1 drug/metabolite exporter YedA [Anaeromyxobacter oryzae]
MRTRIGLVYVAVAFLWGSTWLVVRLGLADLPPLLFAGVRMSLAAAILAPFALRGGHWREVVGPLRARVALVGLFQIAVPYGLLFAAQQWVPSGLSAVLFATFPVWIALVARVLLPGERLGPGKLLSAVLGVGGVAVLQWPHLQDLETSRTLALGSALIVLASIVVAIANVLARRHLVTLTPLALTAGQTIVGSAVLLAAAALLERGAPVAFTPRAWGALLYLAVFGTALTYLGLYWLVPRVPIAAIGAIPLLDTTVAVFLGAVVLGEPLSWNMAGGAGMVLAAAALATRDTPG